MNVDEPMNEQNAQPASAPSLTSGTVLRNIVEKNAYDFAASRIRNDILDADEDGWNGDEGGPDHFLKGMNKSLALLANLNAPEVRLNAYNCLTLGRSVASENVLANDKYLKAKEVELELMKISFAQSRLALAEAWQKERTARAEADKMEKELKLHSVKYGDAALLDRQLREAQQIIAEKDQEIEKYKNMIKDMVA